jgi:hypothetical protein
VSDHLRSIYIHREAVAQQALLTETLRLDFYEKCSAHDQSEQKLQNYFAICLGTLLEADETNYLTVT